LSIASAEVPPKAKRFETKLPPEVLMSRKVKPTDITDLYENERF
jgi:hypothetical protein